MAPEGAWRQLSPVKTRCVKQLGIGQDNYELRLPKLWITPKKLGVLGRQEDSCAWREKEILSESSKQCSPKYGGWSDGIMLFVAKSITIL
ncbi:hypothetical protein RRG08_043501 [Elysia crispata]|uniref:Uncharacterized protein n=1 Tax=Elysia crispata TaxID=231223 RepID=A0AAE0YFI5_9GAST|nr:hypothetical protein RRG08_043501 [Elysia crispata]